MLDLSAHLFQVSDNWQYVHDKETRNCTDKSQYASNLGVKYSDKGWDQKNSNIYWVENFICDLLVFEEQLKTEGSQKVVDQRKTAEKESKQGKTHYESQNVCSFKHLHAILSHHVSVWPTLMMFRVVNIIIVKVLAHESN